MCISRCRARLIKLTEDQKAVKAKQIRLDEEIAGREAAVV
jgi:hypothetical protein